MMDRVIIQLPKVITMAGCIWSLGRGAAELDRPETERERGESNSKITLAPDDTVDRIIRTPVTSAAGCMELGNLR